MDVNEKEKMYHEVEQSAMKKLSETKNLQSSVAQALFDSYKNLNTKDILAFVEYLEFTHGSSINAAYNQNLGNIAKVDYEILNQCKGIEKELKRTEVVEISKEVEKANKRFEKKYNQTKKHAEELLEELSK